MATGPRQQTGEAEDHTFDPWFTIYTTTAPRSVVEINLLPRNVLLAGSTILKNLNMIIELRHVISNNVAF